MPKNAQYTDRYDYNSLENAEFPKAEDVLTAHSPYGEFPLSKRESECIMCLIKGKTIKEIAHDLKLSPKTIEGCLNNIKFKLSTTSRSKIIENILKSATNRMLIFLRSAPV